MKGLHVDEPAFHLGIPSLFPVTCKFAASSALEPSNHGVLSSSAKQEDLPLHDLEPKFPGLQSFPSSKSMASCTIKPSSFAEEKKTRGLACLGKPMCNSAEINDWDINHLGNMILPGGEKQTNMDDSVCRNMRRFSPVGDLQASMEAMKGDYMPGLKYYMGNERDYGSNLQAPVPPIIGHRSCRLKDLISSDQVNYIDDSQASTMFTLSCMSPPRDHSCWRFLPSNHEEHSTDFFSSDDFRMYEFKVRRCMRGRSHDWTECPFAHPGEKARRRDPRRFHYLGTACPDFRRGTCRRGDSCELSHGVFECWLHPARYRTQLCKDGKSCKRRVCFFAHSSSQLRYISPDPIPDSGLALKLPLASPTDAMASYSDVPFKHLPFFANNSSPVGQGSLGDYVGDMFLDDFSPLNIPGFPFDGIHDGFCPHPVHSKRVQNDRNFENFNGRNSHDHGLSIDDISEHLKLNSHIHMASSDGQLLDEFGHEGIHGHRLYPHTYGNPPSDNSSFKTSQNHVNLRNQLAFASLTSNIDQILSPTSTLIGHAFSPPPLSPPLSPSESPPMSPATAFSSWSSLSHKIPSLCGQPQSQGLAAGVDANPMIANGTSPSVTQFHGPLLANLAQSNGAPLFANTRGLSPLSTSSLEGKKHESEKLHSMPTSQELIEDGNLRTSSVEAYPAHALAHLISTLQQMESRCAMMDVKNIRRPHLSHSNPNTPKSRECWDANGGASYQRVESGQGLRAKIYRKLGREAGIDIEHPDLAWVNELVK